MVNNFTISKRAKEDIVKITVYYNLIDVKTTIDFSINLSKYLELLKSFPEIGHIYNENRRKIPIQKYKYIIYYQINKSNLIISRVLHMGQDASKLLK